MENWRAGVPCASMRAAGRRRVQHYQSYSVCRLLGLHRACICWCHGHGQQRAACQGLDLQRLSWYQARVQSKPWVRRDAHTPDFRPDCCRPRGIPRTQFSLQITSRHNLQHRGTRDTAVPRIRPTHSQSLYPFEWSPPPPQANSIRRTVGQGGVVWVHQGGTPGGRHGGHLRPSGEQPWHTHLVHWPLVAGQIRAERGGRVASVRLRLRESNSHQRHEAGNRPAKLGRLETHASPPWDQPTLRRLGLGLRCAILQCTGKGVG